MAMYKIVQTVEEIYYIEAENKEEAVELLYGGDCEPNMTVESIELYVEEELK